MLTRNAPLTRTCVSTLRLRQGPCFLCSFVSSRNSGFDGLSFTRSNRETRSLGRAAYVAARLTSATDSFVEPSRLGHGSSSFTSVFPPSGSSGRFRDWLGEITFCRSPDPHLGPGPSLLSCSIQSRMQLRTPRAMRRLFWMYYTDYKGLPDVSALVRTAQHPDSGSPLHERLQPVSQKPAHDHRDDTLSV